MQSLQFNSKHRLLFVDYADLKGSCIDASYLESLNLTTKELVTQFVYKKIDASLLVDT